jgi:hypothetical protein
MDRQSWINALLAGGLIGSGIVGVAQSAGNTDRMDRISAEARAAADIADQAKVIAASKYGSGGTVTALGGADIASGTRLYTIPGNVDLSPRIKLRRGMSEKEVMAKIPWRVCSRRADPIEIEYTFYGHEFISERASLGFGVGINPNKGLQSWSNLPPEVEVK